MEVERRSWRIRIRVCDLLYGIVVVVFDVVRKGRGGGDPGLGIVSKMGR